MSPSPWGLALLPKLITGGQSPLPSAGDGEVGGKLGSREMGGLEFQAKSVTNRALNPAFWSGQGPLVMEVLKVTTNGT